MTSISAYSSPPAKSTSQHDYILLDRSSSMADKWWETLQAIEAYVSTTRSENVRSHITLSSFSCPFGGTINSYVERNQPIADWTRLESVSPPEGMTPLYDAIQQMGIHLRDLDPPRASILIVTDGEENGSRFTTLDQAKAILDWCRTKGWQVTFIGADFSNAKQGSLLGADKGSAIGVQKRLMSDAARSLGKKRARYGLYGEPMHFSDTEAQQFGGYLNAPSK